MSNEAFKTVLVHLCGAWSLARSFHADLPESKKDALWNTRSKDYERAIEIGRSALSAQATYAAGARDDGWRPISEAPKDETLILASDARIADGQLTTVWWCSTSEKWETNDGAAYGELFFTHFRLLPAPPSDTTAPAGEVRS